ncbi:MAG: hypothetical protein JNL98_05125 [Bryobacterales bacterium]|nr:hypothetical protein [Bryobacterales bacterium]
MLLRRRGVIGQAAGESCSLRGAVHSRTASRGRVLHRTVVVTAAGHFATPSDGAAAGLARQIAPAAVPDVSLLAVPPARASPRGDLQSVALPDTFRLLVAGRNLLSAAPARSSHVDIKECPPPSSESPNTRAMLTLGWKHAME